MLNQHFDDTYSSSDKVGFVVGGWAGFSQNWLLSRLSVEENNEDIKI